jgi:hypothetical protein
VFDKNELDHIDAFKNGNRFETDMGHEDCLRCDVVNGKYGADREHEFLEFNHETGTKLPRDLNHPDCPHCEAAKTHHYLHMLQNADISVNEDGSIKATYTKK